MIAWIQARDALRRVQRVLACALLAWCTVPAWGQANEGMRLTGQKEGTLVVNYYSSAPDPELEQLRSLTVEALGVYLRGQILIKDGDIGWQLSLRQVSRDMERVVSDLMRIRDFTGRSVPWFFPGSPLVARRFRRIGFQRRGAHARGRTFEQRGTLVRARGTTHSRVAFAMWRGTRSFCESGPPPKIGYRGADVDA